MPLWMRGGSGLPQGGAPGQVLGKTDSGETVWVDPTGGVFRGEWSPDELMKQYDFAGATLPPEFTAQASGAKSDMPSLVTLPLVAGSGQEAPTGTPSPFTRAVRFRSYTQNSAPGVNQYSRLTLNVASLGISNITRMRCWLGQNTFVYPSESVTHITVDGTNAYSASADSPWTERTVTLSNPQAITWGIRSNHNTYGGDILAGVTGIRIYAAKQPYMLGEFVTYQGKMWKSLLDNNANTPGTTGWAEALTLPQSSGTTAARPSASVAGVGYQYFDTTLSRPIWSTGTGWVDAGGIAV